MEIMLSRRYIFQFLRHQKCFALMQLKRGVKVVWQLLIFFSETASAVRYRWREFT